MKRILFALLLSIISMGASAQMNDSQVMDYIQSATKAGKSQGQITAQLMQRGVKIDQIRKIRNKYNSENDKKNGSADDTNTNSKLRKNNGDKPRDYMNSNLSDKFDNENNRKAYSKYNRNPNELDEDEESDLKESEKEDRTKKVFGRDIFNNKLLSFEPNMNIATPSNYVLGPGDQVVINIYGGSQSEQTLTISPEGTVVVPNYGPIHLSGLTVARANAKLRRTLGSRYQSSRISTSVGQTRTISVNVMGEVKVPGTYTLSAFATTFHALYMAGGINDLGTLRNIKVYRGGRLISVVDVYEFIMNGRLAGNVRLQDNDVIVVSPYDCLVQITGAVKRPMIYEMRKNESVATILKYAGGFASNAYKKQIRLLRANGKEKQVYTIDEFDMSGFKVMDGDTLRVDSILDRYENMVEVKGAVFRPGLYQLGDQITTVRSLIQQAQGLTEEAYGKHAVIQRMKEDRTKKTIAVDIEAIMNGSAADIPLQNEDVIFIPTEADKIKARTLTIHGEVQFPGTYEYADNTTIEDFIVQAGGLTDAASTAKVDVSRRILDPSSTYSSKKIAETFTFTLENGLIIDKTNDFFLQPYDQVYVRRSPGFKEQRNVSIEGEALFPGDYTLTTKNMRLSELVKAAGGVTQEAYVKGARIERLINEEERLRMETLMRTIKGQDDKDTIKTEKIDLGDTYYVGINLEKALKNPGGNEDITLREGDRLFIPEYNATVKISGDVMYPNTVSYIEGKPVNYYINEAGGYSARAKKSKTFIVYQNGKVSVKGKNKIEPGCEIIVPSKPKKTPMSLTGILSIGTTLASLATVIVALLK
ncbi:SLBB domain-containing protein [Segatella albensis]|uniref:SLBB domain-containing protein n=1 Tax=Segatella albensis TaxID=77768 RepID=UPI0004097E9D|nr:SLBB domain-containing protein [Segatella albensis]